VTDEQYFGPEEVALDRPAGSEPEPASGRSEAERDRDRVLYCSAFQRLSGITQVATSETGQIFHDRLTHSLKVAQLAGRMAQRLIREGADPDKLDVDATEAAALAHDLGHPPFGHITEEVLDELGTDWGGFEGNAQSFRIVNVLAVRRIESWGLGLTSRTLNGMLKYPWERGTAGKKARKWGSYASEHETFLKVRHGHPEDRRVIEAELMDWADDVTFAVHDAEDFHRAGLIPLERVVESRRERDRFFDSFFDDARDRARLRSKFADDGLTADMLGEAVTFLFDELFADVEPYAATRRHRALLRERTSALIGRFAVDGVNAVADGPALALRIEDQQRAEVAVLKELAWFYVITRPSLAIIQHGQQRIVRELHTIFLEAAEDPNRWTLFPTIQRELLERAPDDDRRFRIVTDLLAGLTESMVYELHHRLTGVSTGSILDAAARAAS
jgi:dGTPase